MMLLLNTIESRRMVERKPTPVAERVAKHRVGVKTKLNEIDAKIDAMAQAQASLDETLRRALAHIGPMTDQRQ